MKKFIWFFIILIVGGLLFFGWSSLSRFYSQDQAPNHAELDMLEKMGLPEFDFLDLNGQSISTKKMRGKIVIVNFWATWCGPCVEEYPSLIALANKYSTIEVVALSQDAQIKDVISFVSSFKKPSSNFMIGQDPTGTLSQKFGTFKIPESYVFSKEGKFLKKIPSQINWMSEDSIHYFDSLVKSSD